MPRNNTIVGKITLANPVNTSVGLPHVDAIERHRPPRRQPWIAKGFMTMKNIKIVSVKVGGGYRPSVKVGGGYRPAVKVGGGYRPAVKVGGGYRIAA
jgi:hypothetical protein